MTDDVDDGRRRFLLATVGIAASAAIGPGALALLMERMTRDDATAEAIRALISDRAQAAHLGRAYLDAHRSEGSVAVLVRHLLGPTPSGTSTETRDRIAARIRADYLAFRTVTVDGWILSRTEARLYAFAAMA